MIHSAASYFSRLMSVRIFLVSLAFLVLPGQAFATELLLFAGKSHDKFVGCLNCSRYDDQSVWNKYGTYGSKYNNESIWNKYGSYGSKYENMSPWNKYANEAPVIVDREGNYYGKFTSNKYDDQTKIEWALWLLNNKDYVVENFDEVRAKF